LSVCKSQSSDYWWKCMGWNDGVGNRWLLLDKKIVQIFILRTQNQPYKSSGGERIAIIECFVIKFNDNHAFSSIYRSSNSETPRKRYERIGCTNCSSSCASYDYYCYSNSEATRK